MPASVQLYFKCSIIQNGFNFLDQNHHKDNEAETLKSWLFIVQNGEIAQKYAEILFIAHQNISGSAALLYCHFSALS